MPRRLIILVLVSATCTAPAAAQELQVPVPRLGGPTDSTPIEGLVDPLRIGAIPSTAPRMPEVDVSPNTGMPRMEGGEKTLTIVTSALASSEYIDDRYVANSRYPDDRGLWEKLRVGSREQVHRLVMDYKNFYLSENMLHVGLAVGLAAPIANTTADQHFRDWYQRQAPQGRNRGWDDTATFFKNFGEYKYAIPGYVVLAAGGHLFPDNPLMELWGDFGSRGLRALAVGAPMVGILQVGLGSERPQARDSYWDPFRSSHGASGHAFVGAVPFLTAASMTDCRPLQALLIAGSVMPAWSRIHTDDHYLSQVLLGYAIAYLSVQAVNQTEGALGGRVTLMPVAFPEGWGVGMMIRY